jgi:hypothetical protein
MKKMMTAMILTALSAGAAASRISI